MCRAAGWPFEPPRGFRQGPRVSHSLPLATAFPVPELSGWQRSTAGVKATGNPALRMAGGWVGSRAIACKQRSATEGDCSLAMRTPQRPNAANRRALLAARGWSCGSLSSFAVARRFHSSRCTGGSLHDCEPRTDDGADRGSPFLLPAHPARPGNARTGQGAWRMTRMLVEP